MMKPRDFIETMQRMTAVTAVGPSALRGQGKGVLKAAQLYLGSINLSEIPTATPEEYEDWLDTHTDTLLNTLPIRNRPWGAARKALNLFMRDALYNQYLNDHYGIRKIETWLEVPLDSAVAKGLKKRGEEIEHVRLPYNTPENLDQGLRWIRCLNGKSIQETNDGEQA